MYFVYFLLTNDQSYYVGYCGDLKKRIKEHNSGKTKSLKAKLPVKLVYYETYLTKQQARMMEIELKKSWSKKELVIKKLKTLGPIV